jgi:uncharacterized protein YuzE
MRITFDYAPELDHAYLQLGEGRPVVETVEIEDKGLRLDFDADGLLVGVEFPEAGARVPLAGAVWDEDSPEGLNEGWPEE